MSAKISGETNALNWFEIPVTDIDRATSFYESIFDISLFRMEMGGMKMAMFPGDGTSGQVGGALAQSPMHIPSATGTLVYLNGNPDLQLVLDRVEAAGGKIQMPKTLISESIGYMAFITDTEGNSAGLHSTEQGGNTIVQ